LLIYLWTLYSKRTSNYTPTRVVKRKFIIALQKNNLLIA
jgi:hypothetical protein